jgi:Tol biopolymer transport system component
MHRKNLLLIAFIAIIFSSCGDFCNKEQGSTQNIIGKPTLELSNDLQSPEVLWAYGRLGDVQVSPDGNNLLYGVSYYSIEENKGNRELYISDTDGSNLRQITNSPKSERGV